jgi:hypothetical protein
MEPTHQEPVLEQLAQFSVGLMILYGSVSSTACFTGFSADG